MRVRRTRLQERPPECCKVCSLHSRLFHQHHWLALQKKGRTRSVCANLSDANSTKHIARTTLWVWKGLLFLFKLLWRGTRTSNMSSDDTSRRGRSPRNLRGNRDFVLFVLLWVMNTVWVSCWADARLNLLWVESIMSYLKAVLELSWFSVRVCCDLY